MNAVTIANHVQNSSLFRTVFEHRESLENLNNWWDKVALVGKINSLNVPQSLLSNMLDTKAQFAELQESLIENLLSENMQQCTAKNHAIAQTLIDIPIRNLFERTADVGFLATDSDIIDFIRSEERSETSLLSMKQRLVEYAAKYSVYDDIMIFNHYGDILIQMASDTSDVKEDSIIKDVLSSKQEYVEVCRYSPLRPDYPVSSLFLAPIKDEKTGSVIGVLCLSFKLENEMSALFDGLGKDDGTVMALLDEKGNTLVSSNHSVLSQGKHINTALDNQIIQIDGQEYFAAFASTRGYQGYFGLGWQGCVLLPFTEVVSSTQESTETDQDVLRWHGFSPTLNNIQHNAKIVTEDLDLVVLNGRIAAARSDADEFIPILEEIRKIGREMQSIFTDSVRQLMKTALTTHYNNLTFKAALAIDIMDRNLYERANDCRWWALTSVFQQQLTPENSSTLNTLGLTEVLSYINSLYTVYTGIYLYNRHGEIVAVSNQNLNKWLGTKVKQNTGWGGVNSINNSQQYCVSSFELSDYYEEKPTYIYNAAIRNHSSVVGGIGIVFDSEPQFKQMLDDVLANSQQGCFGLFVDRNGTVISVTRTDLWQVGDFFDLPDEIRNKQNGEMGAGIYNLGDKEYILGYSVSKGYREYKNQDGYINDVIAVICELNTRAC